MRLEIQWQDLQSKEHHNDLVTLVDGSSFIQGSCWPMGVSSSSRTFHRTVDHIAALFLIPGSPRSAPGQPYSWYIYGVISFCNKFTFSFSVGFGHTHGLIGHVSPPPIHRLIPKCEVTLAATASHLGAGAEYGSQGRSGVFFAKPVLSSTGSYLLEGALNFGAKHMDR